MHRPVRYIAGQRSPQHPRAGRSSHPRHGLRVPDRPAMGRNLAEMVLKDIISNSGDRRDHSRHGSSARDPRRLASADHRTCAPGQGSDDGTPIIAMAPVSRAHRDVDHQIGKGFDLARTQKYVTAQNVFLDIHLFSSGQLWKRLFC